MSHRCSCGRPLLGDDAGEKHCAACLLGLALTWVISPGGDGGPEINDSAGQPSLGAIGRYQLEQEVGRGASGVVYRAWDPKVRRHVALKTLHTQPDAPDLETQRRRFRHEATVVAQLEHPRIVPLYDHGEHHGTPWMVQRLFSDGDLLRAIQKPVDPDQAARWVMDLADAVAEAHRQGVLHRDIKPSNVFLDEKGDVFLGDFGLARSTAPWTEGFTLPVQAMGSPGYMAPEQARGDSHAMGPAADIHGLGALLYHALTGFAPFTGSSLGAVLRRVIEEDAVPVSRLNPRVPADLEAVCMKCLEKEPDRRYANAAGLRDDLRRFLAGEPTLARPISALGRAWRWCRRRWAISVLAGSLLVALIVGLAVTSTAVVRKNSAEAERLRTQDRLVFEMFGRWETENQLRRGLDEMVRVLRETPGHTAAVRRTWAALDAQRIPLPRQVFDVPRSIAAAFDESGDHVLFLTVDLHLMWVDARDGRVLGQHAISNSPELLAVGLSPTGDHAWALRRPDVLQGWSLPDWKPMEGGAPRAWCPPPAPLPASMKDLGSLAHEFTPDGRRVAMAFERGKAFLELRESPSGRLILRTEPGVHLVDGAAPFASRGRPPQLLAWSGDGLHIFDVADGAARVELVSLGKPPEFACWHPEGDRLLVVPLHGKPVLLDVPVTKPLEPRFHASRPIHRLAYSPDGRFISVGTDGDKGYLLDAMTWREVTPAPRAVASHPWAAWTRDGLLTVGTNGTAVVVIPGQSNSLTAFDTAGSVAAFTVSPDRRWAATMSGEGLLELWDLARIPARRAGFQPIPEVLQRNRGTSNNPHTLFAFHPNSRHLVMTWQNGEAEAWTVPGLLRTSLLGSGVYTTSGAFHPEEEYFVAAEQVGKVWGWDLRGRPTGKAASVAHLPFVGQIAFDVSGRHLILAGIGGRAEIRPWPPRPGDLGVPITSGGAWRIGPSPCDASCLICLQDGDIELRGIPDGLLQAHWKLPNTFQPTIAAWSPDGSRAVVGTRTGAVFELRIPPPLEPVPDWLVDWAEALGQRSLERDPFGPGNMADRIIAWRRRLAELRGDGFWETWGRSMGLPR